MWSLCPSYLPPVPARGSEAGESGLAIQYLEALGPRNTYPIQSVPPSASAPMARPAGVDPPVISPLSPGGSPPVTRTDEEGIRQASRSWVPNLWVRILNLFPLCFCCIL